jgi:hypothetical protein
MSQKAKRNITLALLLTVVGLFSLVGRTPAQDSSLTFMVLGDTRTGHAAHQSVVDKMLELGPPPFYLHTGDFVDYGSDMSQWETFLDIEHDLMQVSTLYPAIGNHEMNHRNYFDALHPPGPWYSFDQGDAHFVSLQVDGYGRYTPGQPQYEWLASDLANTSKPWKFVFFHIPPYSSGGHGSDLNVRQALAPLFEQYGVTIVFNGHDHDYERSVANGVTYIVTGGGGAPLYPEAHDNPASVYFASVHHFVQITLSGDTLYGVDSLWRHPLRCRYQAGRNRVRPFYHRVGRVNANGHPDADAHENTDRDSDQDTDGYTDPHSYGHIRSSAR